MQRCISLRIAYFSSFHVKDLRCIYPAQLTQYGSLSDSELVKLVENKTIKLACIESAINNDYERAVRVRREVVERMTRIHNRDKKE
jgi:hypothetical protein